MSRVHHQPPPPDPVHALAGEHVAGNHVLVQRAYLRVPSPRPPSRTSLAAPFSQSTVLQVCRIRRHIVSAMSPLLCSRCDRTQHSHMSSSRGSRCGTCSCRKYNQSEPKPKPDHNLYIPSKALGKPDNDNSTVALENTITRDHKQNQTKPNQVHPTQRTTTRPKLRQKKKRGT